MSREQNLLDELRALVGRCSRAVAFTGAGISTESGIPDFRSPGGFWTKYKPIEFADFLASEEMRAESWRRKLAADEAFSRAEPNRGHRALAELVKTGKVACVITQNIDGLHQRSGIPDERVIELHGNGTYGACLTCGRRYELQAIFAAFKATQVCPRCESCGGFVKTATISFGQPMPADAMRLAAAESTNCDLFLAIGSSLVVYPAASFPVRAKRSGARLAIINRDPTDLDYLADLVLNLEIGPTLGTIAGVE